MTTAQAVKLYKDKHTRWMYDRWVKDKRVKPEAAGLTDEAIKLIRVTVARVLADLDVHTGTLVVRSHDRTAKCKIEANLLSEAGIDEIAFRRLVFGVLHSIRDVDAAVIGLTPANGGGYLTLIYKP